MHEFKPRGIIKWAPFSALSEYQDAVEQLNLELDRENQAKRSHDFWEFLDSELSYYDGDDITIVYLDENQAVQNCYGVISEKTEEFLIINQQKINKKQIIDIIR